MVVYAAVEGGGTTFRAAIAEGSPDNILDRAEFETTTPEETLSQVKAWLNERSFDALGIASFGPIDLNKASSTFGYITTTPKVLWRQADIVGPLMEGLDCPFAFDTDVNAPAMSEFSRMPAGSSSCAYITVGTGIGVGLVVNGRAVHGLLHPEAGHVAVPAFESEVLLQPNYQIPQGVEANASSGAIALRKGLDPEVPADRRKLAELSDDDPVWDVTAHYLAGLCVNLILIASPEKIVFGGGVMKRECLFPKIRCAFAQSFTMTLKASHFAGMCKWFVRCDFGHRAAVQSLLNGYVQVDQILTDQIDDYIVSSEFGNDAGLIGALALGQFALEETNSPRAKL